METDTGPDVPPDAAPGWAQWLGARVAALRYEALPAQALYWARVGILDTVGVTLGGSGEAAAALACQALDGAPGPALRLGTRQRLGVLDAALVNGAAAHALDFDDSSNTMGGHPSAPLVSALLPLAEQLGSSGRDFITAYAAGFETETKLGMAVNLHHYRKGWHPTATLGVFGAAAACARLMGLDGAATATALALAASFASGIKANFGTMTKPLHVGHCARNGLYAARLAGLGYTANAAAVFEHKQGFLDVFNGPGTYDIAKAMAAWGAPYDLVEPGVAVKQYACCGSTHPAIDAMLALVREYRPAAEDVEIIDVAIHSRRLNHTNRPLPRSALDAKFSLQYVLARALVDGQVAPKDFEDPAWRDPRVAAVLARVRAVAYDEAGTDAERFGFRGADGRRAFGNGFIAGATSGSTAGADDRSIAGTGHGSWTGAVSGIARDFASDSARRPVDQDGADRECANHFAGHVALTLRDGRVLRAGVEQPLGRTSAHPLPADLLRHKFMQCAGMVLREDALGAIADDLAAIDALPRIAALTRRIEEAVRGGD
ncbi:MmgE/PrpD family protein [Bordetella sp. LUAb4]|uniref:MmgE/PrpD family protein n=1 Tax=Bordetella sp. LUAb4 TaxID=2843195 RepID=UPI001E5D4721|nr:MmgE/PrpD family protein [Bordetella sp. LUAb4]